MVRAHFVKRARKQNPVAGKGESYWWWKWRRCPKRYSKTPPRRSQLTRSPFLSALYAIEEGIPQDETDAAALAGALRDAAGEVRSLGEEQAEKRDAMADRFPSGCPAMELLEERATECERIADELERAADAVEAVEGLEDADEWLMEEAREAVKAAVEAVDWSCP